MKRMNPGPGEPIRGGRLLTAHCGSSGRLKASARSTKGQTQRPALACRLALGIALLWCAAAAADVIDATWDGGSGFWTDDDWTFDAGTATSFPANDGTDQFNVFIDGDKNEQASTLTLDRSVTIDSLTVDLDDALVVDPGASLAVVRDPARPSSGDIDNAGAMTLESSDTRAAGLRLEGEVGLSGGGTLTLAGPSVRDVLPGDDPPGMQRGLGFVSSTSAGTPTLVHENHTIEGSGQIGFFDLKLHNLEGALVDANVPDAALVIHGRTEGPDSPGVRNLGTLRASEGGILRLFAGTYDQTDTAYPGTGRIEALADSRVHVERSSVRVEGGELATAAGGELRVQQGGLTLDGVSVQNDGSLLVRRGATGAPASFTATEGAITNTGEMRFEQSSPTLRRLDIDNAGAMTLESSDTRAAGLRLEGEVGLSGGGTLTLAGPSVRDVLPGDDPPGMQRGLGFVSSTSAGTPTLVHENHTIEGSGQIGFFDLKLHNLEGALVDANVPDAALVIHGRTEGPDSPGVRNLGTLRASEGGILRLFAGTYDQTDTAYPGTGRIEALADSRVHVERSSVRVEGGELATAAGGELRVQQGGLTLDGVSVQNDGTTRVRNVGSSRASLNLFDSSLASTGLVEAQDGALVRVTDTEVSGGTMIIDGASRLRSAGASTFDDVAVLGSMTNSGDLGIGPDGASVSETYTQTAGSTTLDGSTLSAGTFDIQGGSLGGSGTFEGDGAVAAALGAGESPGILNFDGDFGFDGSIHIELGGILVDGAMPRADRLNVGTDPDTTEFDQYNVFGDASLADGLTLNVTLIDGFDPVSSSFFDVFTADSLTADLDGLIFDLPSLGADRRFVPRLASFDGRHAIRLDVVRSAPEPQTLALLMSALLVLVIRLHSRPAVERRAQSRAYRS